MRSGRASNSTEKRNKYAQQNYFEIWYCNKYLIYVSVHLTESNPLGDLNMWYHILFLQEITTQEVAYVSTEFGHDFQCIIIPVYWLINCVAFSIQNAVSGTIGRYTYKYTYIIHLSDLSGIRTLVLCECLGGIKYNHGWICKIWHIVNIRASSRSLESIKWKQKTKFSHKFI